ncbi:hypothetical protein ACOMHN_013675 [Nucella lapillus]
MHRGTVSKEASRLPSCLLDLPDKTRGKLASESEEETTPSSQKSDMYSEETVCRGLADKMGGYVDEIQMESSDEESVEGQIKHETAPGTAGRKALLSDDLAETLELLKPMYDSRPCSAASELMKLERIPWYENLHSKLEEMDIEECMQIHGGDKEKLATVEPFLKIISNFREFLSNSDFQGARDVLDQLIRGKDPDKCRRNVLMALYRMSLKTVIGTKSHERPEGLVNLQNRLLQEHMNEQLKVESVKEAFQDRNWPGMKRLYEAQKNSMSKNQLNHVILLAAEVRSWQEFWECVELGADLVRSGIQTTNTAHSEARYSPSDDDSEEDSYGPTQMKRQRTDEGSNELSPLHEAVKTGDFLLEQMENNFDNNRELVRAVDGFGDTLLHLAVQRGKPTVRTDNVKFLIKHKADVNAQDAKGNTALQYLLHSRHKPWEAELLVELVSGSEVVAERTWQAGFHEWTALHALCDRGMYTRLNEFVQKGATPRALRYGLTLIDTIVLQESLHWELKKKTVATLLKEPIRLGDFHAQTVQRRLRDSRLKPYQRMLEGGKGYLSPVDRLLFPLISTHTVRAAYKEIVMLLLKGGAVCGDELRHVQSKLPSLQDDPELAKCLKMALEI